MGEFSAPPGDAFDAASFLGQVERLTATFRAERERHHLGRALEALEVAEAPPEELEDPETGEMLPAPQRYVRRVRKGKKVDVPERVAARVSERWHRGRAKGQRQRFHSLDKCGHGLVHVRCKAAGCSHERGIPQGCSARRLCASCRERAAGPRRDVFARARAESLARAHSLGLLLPTRRGGRWSEKHLTLTIPDQLVTGYDFDVVEQRIALLFAAWPPFMRALRAWLRIRHGSAPVDYFRAFEWTGGADALGHPHFHVWLHCAYLPKHVVRYLWARALHDLGLPVFAGEGDPSGELRAGELARLWRLHAEDSTRRPALRSVTTYPQIEAWDVPIVLEVTEVKIRRTVSEGSEEEGYTRRPDGSFARELLKGADAIKLGARPRLEIVRQKRGTGGEDVIGYLEGWLVSEYDSNGVRVLPATMARVYRALEGRRSVQASAGFMASGRVAVRCPQAARDAAGEHARLDALGESHLRASIVDHGNATLAAWREHFGLAPPKPREVKERAGPGIARAKGLPRKVQQRLGFAT